ncbi:acyl-CoA dehydratase activase-related protein [Clostridium butyricum]|jgi:predicted CoA-substrate-specific enzyme activase|uniref:acyl-CoA dehydratase activase-related protein n=1 Tax=Clostridium TaxID=1485 RepID=UPI000F52B81D|nr:MULTISPECIES: acyl-CoA dehydratase activase-related protein [Clostridium]MDU1004055.1 acyl-CoA dehydratase activase-related protein [Clostridium butyricum]MDU1601910.1 acyl-CoA dehydratase activase-related protein [Clostridium sp.]MDU5720952.1 acyl-CoA dehydratase activase-related protein [Clostridium butyricum]MDU5818720.1 acyl-CoA dehydratase activase-related protein [Clostridium butyricum]RQN01332.1 2-hydroxyglutaryl-CoA dehydratase [Clostridium butyricum]
MGNILKIGVDIGSTTIKMVVIDQDEKILFKTYRRHLADIRNAFKSCLEDAESIIKDKKLTFSISGSGGMSLAEKLNVEFIQEVIASTKAIQINNPETDVVIELGGEDAKITYLNGGVEQRMNGTCAGGTGAFIDQMASLLNMDAGKLNEEAKSYTNIYPIAARCGVFAKTDVQPLINEGAKKCDIAISIFHAVVVQTISVLACGRPILGKVAFLGGPLTFLSELRKRFIEVLKLKDEDVIFPQDSELYVALGAALSCEGKSEYDYHSILARLEDIKGEEENKSDSLEPLFKNKQEYDSFKERHDKSVVKEIDISMAEGKCYLGIDAGSTTTKAVLINEKCEILYSYYAGNKGNPVDTAAGIIKEIYSNIPEGAKIVYSGVTGYGEHLLKEAFSMDIGEIETVAHYKAAKFFCPDVDFILDIGGQDMKCLRIKDGTIQSITLNEACSAGCGSFLQAFAKSLGFEIKDFAKKALFAKSPVDLGSKCTVFMNSKVKQAQKEGFTVEDIAAGLAYSVVKNSLYKVIKLRNPNELGNNIVVQGGTFYNEAVLRSFERLSGRNVIRPNIAGLMGAFGAAILAKENYEAIACSINDETAATVENNIADNKNDKVKKNNLHISNLVSKENVDNIEMKSTNSRCKGCSNSCLLTINRFPNGNRFIAGNKCDTPLGNNTKDKNIPNLYEYKYNRIFNYEPLELNKAKRGIIGIPRVLNMYENYPLWFTLFTNLGFRVEISEKSSKELYEKGLTSIVSETACYPAKMTHGHVEDLIEKGIKNIFYPCILHESREFKNATDTFNCPVVTSYAEVIKNNMDSLEEENVNFMNPFLPIANKSKLKKRLKDALSIFNISQREINYAVDKAWDEQENFKKDIREKGVETLKYIKDHNIQGILLGGRPYHVDPEINHGMPKLINSLGFAVFTEDSVAHLGEIDGKLNVVDQWAYHSRLYRASNFIIDHDDINLVQLTSFGCGLDSITTDAVAEILECGSKIYTNIKIDEGSNLGAARIRLRSLKAAIEERKNKNIETSITKKDTKKFINPGKNKTIIVPQFSPIHFNILESAFRACGYDLVVLNNGNNAIDEGLKYVNNDICYPAIVVIGQVIEALKSGRYDLENTSILLAQSEGQCRFTNYTSVLEKALKEAGYEDLPVLSLSLAGVDKTNSLEGMNLDLVKKSIVGVIYGDLLSRVLHRVRPYEKIKGSADELYKKWTRICRESFEEPLKKNFKSIISSIIKEFEELPRIDVYKPKVGLVGELLVKFNPIANNSIVNMLEKEGVEVVHNDLLSLFLSSAKNQIFNYKHLDGKYISKLKGEITIKLIEKYQKVYIDALKKSRIFYVTEKIDEMAHNASKIISLGNQSGEGWKLPGEIMELENWGVNNVVCMQPFGCLPSHAVARGTIKALKKLNNKLNIVTIEYDPGSSEVNQNNRIKLMLASAFDKI